VYVKGLVTVSAPFGGTTDQAITVRMGAVDWNINEWVKNPIGRIRKDLAAHAQDMAQALHAEDLDDPSDPVVKVAAKRVTRRVSRLAHAIASHHKGDAAVERDGSSGDDVAVAGTEPALHAEDFEDGSDPAVKVAAKRVTRHVSRLAHAIASHRKGDSERDGSGCDNVAVAGGLPGPFAGLVKNYISSAFFKVTMGLPGLAMLLPYPSAYGAWRRIVVTRRKTYTASMMRRLMADIGDGATNHAWPKVQELDTLLAKGRIPGVATYCMYGGLSQREGWQSVTAAGTTSIVTGDR
jgi:hypothetical protein